MSWLLPVSWGFQWWFTGGFGTPSFGMAPWELPSREVLAAPAGGAEEAHGSLRCLRSWGFGYFLGHQLQTSHWWIDGQHLMGLIFLLRWMAKFCSSWWKITSHRVSIESKVMKDSFHPPYESWRVRWSRMKRDRLHCRLHQYRPPLADLLWVGAAQAVFSLWVPSGKPT